MSAAVVALVLTLVVAACGTSSSTDSSVPPPPELPGPPVPTASPAGRPNIVFVLTDDLSTDLLRFMPRVAQLQARGASFTDYNVADTLCCPSRASIFTGRFPHNTGVITNTPPAGGFDVFRDRGQENDTFATALQQAGYRTAMMGKYLNGYQPDSPNGSAPPGAKKNESTGASTGYVPPGWNEWDVAGNGYSEYNYDLNQNGAIRRYGDRPADYLTDVVSARGQQFIRTRAAAQQPFLLEIATFAPHGPATPAPPDANAFPGLTAPRDPSFNQPDSPADPAWLRNRPPLRPGQIDQIDQQYRKRAQSVQAVDRMLGDLENTLAQTGQASNTMIVFSSDNGFHLGQHQLAGGKQTSFSTDLTVPLIVAGPGIAPGRQIPAIAQNVDLAPTFVDAARAGPLPNADGRSLMPVLTGATPPDWRQAALVEHRGPNTAPRDPDRARGRAAANPPSYTAVRTATGTYTEYATGEREWHDRATDPFERTNTVAALPPDRLAALRAAVAALSTCRGTAACTTAARTP